MDTTRPPCRLALPFATATALLLAACQHVPPVPLELEHRIADWEDREIAVAPVSALAAALGAALDDPGTFNLDDGLTLREAEAVALWHHPGLAAARIEAAHALYRRADAGLFPDPGLALEGGRKRERGGGLIPSGIERSWLAGGGLSLTLPLSGRLGAERRAVEALHGAAERRVAEAEWEHLHTLHEAWLHWSARHWERDMLEEHTAAAARFERVAGVLAEAGELDPAAARLFAIARGQAEADLAQVAETTEAGRIRIFGLMGLAPEAPVTLVPALALHGESPEPEDWRRHITERHPELRRLAADYAVAEAQLVQALREQYPDIVLSPGFLDERSESAILLGLGLPVPVWNRNRTGIAEALAAREQLRARIHARQEAVMSDYAAARAEWKGARAKRRILEDTVAPLIDTQLAESQALLDMGEADLTLMESVLTQAIVTKRELVAAHLAEQLALARLQHFLEPHTVMNGADTP